jgi:serine/threonine protein kinase
MLDEYRIDSILGAGGFGVTYKALDTHLRTWVAIKEYFPVEWSFRDSDGVTVYANTQGQSSQNDGQISDYAGDWSVFSTRRGCWPRSNTLMWCG